MSKRLLIELIKKARRDRGRDDIEYFAEYYLGHFFDNEVPEFHREIRNMVRAESRLCIAAPRGFAKSTNVQIIYALWCILYNPTKLEKKGESEDILTISASADMAEDWVRKLKFELEGNDRIKEDFGTLLQWGEKDSKRWTANHLVIQKGNVIWSQIRARGRGCQVRGLRPTRVFCDDLEDDEMVRSDEQRKILKDWFLTALINTLRYDQQLIVVGTVLHPLALLAEIIKGRDEFKEWKVKKYVALQKNGTSLWEDRFPAEVLKKKKLEIGTYKFEQEFQNNPIASDVCLWKPHWILKYGKIPTGVKITKVFVALDPAASIKEKADYSALCAMGVGSDGNVYELETIRGHWGTWDLIENCINFYLKHKPLRFGIEEVAFQSFIRPVLQKEARQRGVILPLERLTLGSYTDTQKKIKDPKDKYTRALSVVHYWEQGLVYLKTEDLIDEISVFPTGEHDDQVDACVYCMRLIMKHAPVASILKEEYKRTVNSFEIKDGMMPNLMALEQEANKNLGHDWRIGA